MKNLVLADIAKYAQDRLQAAYGFVGVATSDDMTMLNSSDHDGNSLIIKIDVKAD